MYIRVMLQGFLCNIYIYFLLKYGIGLKLIPFEKKNPFVLFYINPNDISFQKLLH